MSDNFKGWPEPGSNEERNHFFDEMEKFCKRRQQYRVWPFELLMEVLKAMRLAGYGKGEAESLLERLTTWAESVPRVYTQGPVDPLLNRLTEAFKPK